MKTCEFFKPSTGYQMDDLQQKIMEVILELHTDAGSIEEASESLFRISEIVLANASEKELSNFSKVQGALRCISQLLKEFPETLSDFLSEHEQYKKLKLCTET